MSEILNQDESWNITVFVRGWTPDKRKIILVKNKAKWVQRGFTRFLKPTGYGLPGGGVKPGETPLQAARREFREETGLDFDESEFQEVLKPKVKYKQKHSITVFDLMLPSDQLEFRPNDPEKGVEEAELVDFMETIYLGNGCYKGLRIYSSHIQRMMQ